MKWKMENKNIKDNTKMPVEILRQKFNRFVRLKMKFLTNNSNCIRLPWKIPL